MGYGISEKVVKWSGRKLKGVSGNDFEILSDDRFARTDQAILMKGKPTSALRDSFELLSATFAKDRDQVFQIMDTKLKPIKGVHVPSFLALGGPFGRDKYAAWFEGKAVKEADPATFRKLSARYATDGFKLFAENKEKPLPQNAPIDLSAASLREHPSGTAYDGFVIWDDQRAYFFDPHGLQREWEAIETDKPEDIKFLYDGDEFREPSVWLRDRNSVFWRGFKLPGVNPASVELVSSTVAISDGRVFLGHAHDPDIDAASLIPIDRYDRFADKSAIWRLTSGWFYSGELRADKEHLIDQSKLVTNPESLITTFFRDAIADLIAMFEVMEDLGDLHASNPVDGIMAQPGVTEQIQIVRNDDWIEVTTNQDCASGPASDWYRIACTLWTKRRRHPSYLLHYPKHSHTGTYLQEAVFNRHCDAFLLTAQAFFLLGEERVAHHLAAQILIELFGRGRSVLESFKPETLAQIDPHLLSQARYPVFYYDINVRTCLAGARAAIKRGSLTHPEFQIRFGAVAFLHYMSVETTQHKYFLTEIAPALMDMAKAEKLGFIRDIALGALEAICNRAASEGHGINPQFKPFLEYLAAEHVNTEQNQARLCGAGGCSDRATHTSA